MSQTKMTSQLKSKECGVAMLFCLFALLILTALTTSLILLSSTETSVNANYRSEEVAFFAAKSGIYEALDRLQTTNANSISCKTPLALPGTAAALVPLPQIPPCPVGTPAPAGVLYIINAGSSLTVQPWNSANPYFDDELCHEGFTIGSWTPATDGKPPDVPCTTVPTGTTWYNASVTSNAPWNGTSAAMPYEWVRINWKQNSTESYLSGGPSAPVTKTYSVNSGGSATAAACWNGSSQILLSTPAGVTPAYTSCLNYQSCATTQQTVNSPVLMITALAITSNGSRQMVQAEAAQTPPTLAITQPCASNPGDLYGFFAFGAGFSCSNPSFTIAGNAFVDGYNSANGPYNSSTNHNLAQGSIGTNQGLVEQGSSTNVGGTIYVPNITASLGPPPVTGPGLCPDDFSVSGGPSRGGLAVSTVLTKPTITVPSDASVTDVSSGSIVPGNYRNISLGAHASLTLTAPGTYVVDCITMGSGGSITTSPANKAITIYVTGTGCASTPITMNSHATINNASGVSGNVQIVYNGAGTISLAGGPQFCAIVNAPNAAVTLNGGSDFFGTIMANSIDDHGGVNLHFDIADKNLNSSIVAPTTLTAPATSHYNSLAFKSLPY